MLWIIACKSRSDITDVRAAALPAHRAFLDAKAGEIFFAGGLQNDDATDSTGALFILKVGSRDQARAFIDAEPLNRAGVFETVTIDRLVKGRFHPHLVDA